MAFIAALKFVKVHQLDGNGSDGPQPQTPFDWSLYLFVLAHNFPLNVGGQPVHLGDMGTFALEQR